MLIEILCLPAPDVLAASGQRSIFADKQAAHEAVQQRNLRELMHKKGMHEEQSQALDREPMAAVQPEPLSLAALPDLSALQIPAEDGQVLEVWQPGAVSSSSEVEKPTSNAPTVILLQDLHMQPDAQMAEGRILKHLFQTYDIRRVAMEGAAGPLPIEFFKQFPRNRELRRLLADTFLQVGEMSGPEYPVVTEQLPIEFVGVEDDALHEANGRVFQELLEAAPKAKEEIARIRQALALLEPQLYPEKLQTFETQVAAFESGELAFAEYVDVLQRHFSSSEAAGRVEKEHPVSPPMALHAPNLVRLLGAQELESSIDQSQVQDQLQRLLAALSTQGLPQSARQQLDTLLSRFQQQQISAGYFYPQLLAVAREATEAVSPTSYPALTTFADYLALSQSVQTHRIGSELDAVRWELAERLADTDDARELVRMTRHAKLLQDLGNLHLVPEQLAYYDAHRAECRLDVFASFLEKQGAPGLARSDETEQAIAAATSLAEQFYDLAKQRDRVLLDNTLALTQGGASVLLVVGGFHTPGMTALLRERDVPYAVVTPATVGDVDEARYHRLVRGETASLDELLDVAQRQYAGQRVAGRQTTAFKPKHEIRARPGAGGISSFEKTLALGLLFLLSASFFGFSFPGVTPDSLIQDALALLAEQSGEGLDVLRQQLAQLDHDTLNALKEQVAAWQQQGLPAVDIKVRLIGGLDQLLGATTPPVAAPLSDVAQSVAEQVQQITSVVPDGADALQTSADVAEKMSGSSETVAAVSAVSGDFLRYGRSRQVSEAKTREDEPRVIEFPDEVDQDEEASSMRDAVLEFTKGTLNPATEKAIYMGSVDTVQGLFRAQDGRSASALGLFGMSIPAQYHDDTPPVRKAINSLVHMLLGWASLAFGLSVGVHGGVSTYPIVTFGTEKQKQMYLPKLATGEWVGAYCLTEPRHGTDTLALNTVLDTKATKKWVPQADGESEGHWEWELTGDKVFVTNGEFADVFIVFAMVEDPTATEEAQRWKKSVFVVPKSSLTEGSTIKPRKKRGLHGSSTTDIYFDHVRVTSDHLLGQLGDGDKIGRSTMSHGRTQIAAWAAGGTRRAFEETRHDVATRIQSGVPIANNTGVQEDLAEMEAVVYAQESMVSGVSALFDAGGAPDLEAAIAKVWITERFQQMAARAADLAGGKSFLSEELVGSIHNDSTVSTIFEGANKPLLSQAVAPLALKYMKDEVLKQKRSLLDDWTVSDSSPLADDVQHVKRTAELVLAVAKQFLLTGAKAKPADQGDFERFGRMVADLYAMVVTINRTQHRLDQNMPSDHEVALTNLVVMNGVKALEDRAGEFLSPWTVWWHRAKIDRRDRPALQHRIAAHTLETFEPWTRPGPQAIRIPEVLSKTAQLFAVAVAVTVTAAVAIGFQLAPAMGALLILPVVVLLYVTHSVTIEVVDRWKSDAAKALRGTGAYTLGVLLAFSALKIFADSVGAQSFVEGWETFKAWYDQTQIFWGQAVGSPRAWFSILGAGAAVMTAAPGLRQLWRKQHGPIFVMLAVAAIVAIAVFLANPDAVLAFIQSQSDVAQSVAEQASQGAIFASLLPGRGDDRSAANGNGLTRRIAEDLHAGGVTAVRLQGYIRTPALLQEGGADAQTVRDVMQQNDINLAQPDEIDRGLLPLIVAALTEIERAAEPLVEQAPRASDAVTVLQAQPALEPIVEENAQAILLESYEVSSTTIEAIAEREDGIWGGTRKGILVDQSGKIVAEGQIDSNERLQRVLRGELFQVDVRRRGEAQIGQKPEYDYIVKGQLPDSAKRVLDRSFGEANARKVELRWMGSVVEVIRMCSEWTQMGQSETLDSARMVSAVQEVVERLLGEREDISPDRMREVMATYRNAVWAGHPLFEPAVSLLESVLPQVSEKLEQRYVGKGGAAERLGQEVGRRFVESVLGEDTSARETQELVWLDDGTLMPLAIAGPLARLVSDAQMADEPLTTDEARFVMAVAPVMRALARGEAGDVEGRVRQAATMLIEGSEPPWNAEEAEIYLNASVELVEMEQNRSPFGVEDDSVLRRATVLVFRAMPGYQGRLARYVAVMEALQQPARQAALAQAAGGTIGLDGRFQRATTEPATDRRSETRLPRQIELAAIAIVATAAGDVDGAVEIATGREAMMGDMTTDTTRRYWELREQHRQVLAEVGLTNQQRYDQSPFLKAKVTLLSALKDYDARQYALLAVVLERMVRPEYEAVFAEAQASSRTVEQAADAVVGGIMEALPGLNTPADATASVDTDNDAVDRAIEVTPEFGAAINQLNASTATEAQKATALRTAMDRQQLRDSARGRVARQLQRLVVGVTLAVLLVGVGVEVYQHLHAAQSVAEYAQQITAVTAMALPSPILDDEEDAPDGTAAANLRAVVNTARQAAVSAPGRTFQEVLREHIPLIADASRRLSASARRGLRPDGAAVMRVPVGGVSLNFGADLLGLVGVVPGRLGRDNGVGSSRYPAMSVMVDLHDPGNFLVVVHDGEQIFFYHALTQQWSAGITPGKDGKQIGIDSLLADPVASAFATKALLGYFGDPNIRQRIIKDYPTRESYTGYESGGKAQNLERQVGTVQLSLPSTSSKAWACLRNALIIVKEKQLSTRQQFVALVDTKKPDEYLFFMASRWAPSTVYAFDRSGLLAEYPGTAGVVKLASGHPLLGTFLQGFRNKYAERVVTEVGRLAPRFDTLTAGVNRGEFSIGGIRTGGAGFTVYQQQPIQVERRVGEPEIRGWESVARMSNVDNGVSADIYHVDDYLFAVSELGAWEDADQPMTLLMGDAFYLPRVAQSEVASESFRKIVGSPGTAWGRREEGAPEQSDKTYTIVPAPRLQMLVKHPDGHWGMRSVQFVVESGSKWQTQAEQLARDAEALWDGVSQLTQAFIMPSAFGHSLLAEGGTPDDKRAKAMTLDALRENEADGWFGRVRGSQEAALVNAGVQWDEIAGLIKALYSSSADSSIASYQSPAGALQTLSRFKVVWVNIPFGIEGELQRVAVGGLRGEPLAAKVDRVSQEAGATIEIYVATLQRLSQWMRLVPESTWAAGGLTIHRVQVARDQMITSLVDIREKLLAMQRTLNGAQVVEPPAFSALLRALDGFEAGLSTELQPANMSRPEFTKAAHRQVDELSSVVSTRLDAQRFLAVLGPDGENDDQALDFLRAKLDLDRYPAEFRRSALVDDRTHEHLAEVLMAAYETADPNQRNAIGQVIERMTEWLAPQAGEAEEAKPLDLLQGAAVALHDDVSPETIAEDMAGAVQSPVGQDPQQPDSRRSRATWGISSRLYEIARRHEARRLWRENMPPERIAAIEQHRQEIADQPAQQLTIVLTGAAGFIGSTGLERILNALDGKAPEMLAILQDLLKERRLDRNDLSKIKIIAVDNFKTGDAYKLEAMRRFHPRGGQVEIYSDHDPSRADISSPTFVRDFEEAYGDQLNRAVFINEAAFVSAPDSNKEPRVAHQDNVVGVANMLALAGAWMGKMVVISTAATIKEPRMGLDGQAELISEQASYNPLTHYGHTKGITELFARFAEQAWGQGQTTLAYANVLGELQARLATMGNVTGIVGEAAVAPSIARGVEDYLRRLYGWKTNGFWIDDRGEQHTEQPTMTKFAIYKASPDPNYPNNEDGGWRDFIPVDAFAAYAACLAGLSAHDGKFVRIGSGHRIQVRQFYHMYAKHLVPALAKAIGFTEAEIEQHLMPDKTPEQGGWWPVPPGAEWRPGDPAESQFNATLMSDTEKGLGIAQLPDLQAYDALFQSMAQWEAWRWVEQNRKPTAEEYAKAKGWELYKSVEMTNQVKALLEEAPLQEASHYARIVRKEGELLLAALEDPTPETMKMAKEWLDLRTGHEKSLLYLRPMASSIEQLHDTAVFLANAEREHAVDRKRGRQIADDCLEQLELAIAGKPSSLSVRPSGAGQPTGKEKGLGVVTDLSGSNTRGEQMELFPDAPAGQPKIVSGGERKVPVTAEMKQEPAEKVFDRLVDVIKTAINNDTTQSYNLAFIYSFDADQVTVNIALPGVVSKGFTLRGLQGRNVVAFLQERLNDGGFSNVKVTAVANDTIATLIYDTWLRRSDDETALETIMGIIAGSGTNKCLDLTSLGLGIVNLEGGNYWGLALIKLQTKYDKELDATPHPLNPGPGVHLLEKMQSGVCLGELARRMIVDMAGKTGLFQNLDRDRFVNALYGLDSEYLSQIAVGNFGPFERNFNGGYRLSPMERKSLQNISRMLAERSAALLTATMLGELRAVDPKLEREHFISVDGSVFGKYPGYQDMVRAAIERFAGKAVANRLHVNHRDGATSYGIVVMGATKAPELTPEQTSLAGKRVLFVGADTTSRQRLAQACWAREATIEFAGSPQEAKLGQADVIFVDVNRTDSVVESLLVAAKQLNARVVFYSEKLTNQAIDRYAQDCPPIYVVGDVQISEQVEETIANVLPVVTRALAQPSESLGSLGATTYSRVSVWERQLFELSRPFAQGRGQMRHLSTQEEWSTLNTEAGLLLRELQRARASSDGPSAVDALAPRINRCLAWAAQLRLQELRPRFHGTTVTSGEFSIAWVLDRMIERLQQARQAEAPHVDDIVFAQAIEAAYADEGLIEKLTQEFAIPARQELLGRLQFEKLNLRGPISAALQMQYVRNVAKAQESLLHDASVAEKELPSGSESALRNATTLARGAFPLRLQWELMMESVQDRRRLHVSGPAQFDGGPIVIDGMSVTTQEVLDELESMGYPHEEISHKGKAVVLWNTGTPPLFSRDVNGVPLDRYAMRDGAVTHISQVYWDSLDESGKVALFFHEEGEYFFGEARSGLREQGESSHDAANRFGDEARNTYTAGTDPLTHTFNDAAARMRLGLQKFGPEQERPQPATSDQAPALDPRFQAAEMTFVIAPGIAQSQAVQEYLAVLRANDANVVTFAEGLSIAGPRIYIGPAEAFGDLASQEGFSDLHISMQELFDLMPHELVPYLNNEFTGERIQRGMRAFTFA